MFKINPALCFKPYDLIKYLQQVTKETTIAEEIAAAVTHRLVMEKELGWKNYFIYFEPNDAKQAEMLKKIGSTMAYSELEDLLKNYTQQATPIDYAFVNTDVSPADVYPVQHKRYFPDMAADATYRFIKALK